MYPYALTPPPFPGRCSFVVAEAGGTRAASGWPIDLPLGDGLAPLPCFVRLDDTGAPVNITHGPSGRRLFVLRLAFLPDTTQDRWVATFREAERQFAAILERYSAAHVRRMADGYPIVAA